jgi:hypothetical protein
MTGVIGSWADNRHTVHVDGTAAMELIPTTNELIRRGTIFYVPPAGLAKPGSTISLVVPPRRAPDPYLPIDITRLTERAYSPVVAVADADGYWEVPLAYMQYAGLLRIAAQQADGEDYYFAWLDRLYEPGILTWADRFDWAGPYEGPLAAWYPRLILPLLPWLWVGTGVAAWVPDSFHDPLLGKASGLTPVVRELGAAWGTGGEAPALSVYSGSDPGVRITRPEPLLTWELKKSDPDRPTVGPRQLPAYMTGQGEADPEYGVFQNVEIDIPVVSWLSMGFRYYMYEDAGDWLYARFIDTDQGYVGPWSAAQIPLGVFGPFAPF